MLQSGSISKRWRSASTTGWKIVEIGILLVKTPMYGLYVRHTLTLYTPGPIPYRITQGHHHREEEEVFDDKTFTGCERDHMVLGNHVVQGVGAR
jgi:hypothetical protein